MRSLYFPFNSFKNSSEYKRIYQLFLEYSQTLCEEIDDNVEISIFGNRDLNMIRRISGFKDRQKAVIDPSDQLPIPEHDDLKYIALVNYENLDKSTVSSQIIYGSVEYKLHDFISLLLYRLATKFPKSGNTDLIDDDFINEKEMEEISINLF